MHYYNNICLCHDIHITFPPGTICYCEHVNNSLMAKELSFLFTLSLIFFQKDLPSTIKSYDGRTDRQRFNTCMTSNCNFTCSWAMILMLAVLLSFMFSRGMKAVCLLATAHGDCRDATVEGGRCEAGCVNWGMMSVHKINPLTGVSVNQLASTILIPTVKYSGPSKLRTNQT